MTFNIGFQIVFLLTVDILLKSLEASFLGLK